MPFAVEFSPEGIAIIGALLAFVVGGLVQLHRQLMQSKTDHADFMAKQYEDRLKEKDDALAKEKHTITSLQQITEEALRVGEKLLKPKLPTKLAKVVPESSSPPSEEQIQTAKIADLRARVVRVTLASELGEAEIVTPAVAEKLLSVAEELPDKVAAKVVEKIDEGKKS